MRIRRWLAGAALSVLLACAIYGFLNERLLGQEFWTPEGRARFLGYTAFFWAAAALILTFWPAWLCAIAAAFVFGYSVWWCGPIAPLAVVYVLVSSFLLGKSVARGTKGVSTLLVGLAAWILPISIALHFPVNFRWVYVAAFAIPFAIGWKLLPAWLRNFRLAPASRREAAALAVLLFVLLTHWLVTLKPEVSADGLSMHLALPMSVAHDGRWAFDFRMHSWALMPIGGDCLFTAAYLMGGEAAARLLNFAVLAAMAFAVFRVSRRWLCPATAWLAAALFVSTPLTQLVTGSLFVENFWAAMVLGASVALWRYLEPDKSNDGHEGPDRARAYLVTAGILFGAALSVKLMAVAFIAPAAAIACFTVARRKQVRAAVPAAMLLLVFAAPPYLYAWWKTGNPVFPFANSVFRSPYFPKTSLIDARYNEPLTWKTPYEATFRSSHFYEGRNGSFGFQYFLLLLPAAILMSRRAPRALLGIAVSASFMLLAILPNLRYLYPALAPFSVAIAYLASEMPGTAVLFVALTAINTWFLPASGWYHNEFALFRREQVGAYLERSAPVRKLVDHLNRTAPGEPVAFFDSDSIAGLHAAPYTDSWHSEPYWSRVRNARLPEEIAAILREFGIHHAIAPLTGQVKYPVIRTFLAQWTTPTGISSGVFGRRDVLASPVPTPIDRTPAPPGAYDNVDPRIEYAGAWLDDHQFSRAADGSLTYSNVPGNTLRFAFRGSGITYVYTKALNRGIAAVSIDGVERARINLYSRQTKWQAETSFGGLDPGPHMIEVRILGRKDPRSSDYYVDLDRFVVNP